MLTQLPGSRSLVKKLKDEGGYSLVEVMVAIMLLSIAIMPMAGMFDAGLKAATQGSNYDKARALANGKLDEVRALRYADLIAKHPPVNGSPAGATVACPPSPPDYGPFTCTIKTTYVDYVGDSLQPSSTAKSAAQIDVVVKWDGGSKSFATTGLKTKGSF